jgi:hypothetical protein
MSTSSSRRGSLPSDYETEDDEQAQDGQLMIQDRPYDISEIKVLDMAQDYASRQFCLLLQSPLGHPYRFWTFKTRSTYDKGIWLKQFAASKQVLEAEPFMSTVQSPTVARSVPSFGRSRSQAVSQEDSPAGVRPEKWRFSSLASRSSQEEAATSAHSSQGSVFSVCVASGREPSGSPLRLKEYSRSSSVMETDHSSECSSATGSSASLLSSEGCPGSAAVRRTTSLQVPPRAPVFRRPKSVSTLQASQRNESGGSGSALRFITSSRGADGAAAHHSDEGEINLDPASGSPLVPVESTSQVFQDEEDITPLASPNSSVIQQVYEVRAQIRRTSQVSSSACGRGRGLAWRNSFSDHQLTFGSLGEGVLGRLGREHGQPWRCDAATGF